MVDNAINTIKMVRRENLNWRGGVGRHPKVSGLSFALTARKIKEKARVVAMDLRGHGKSSTDNDVDLPIDDPLVTKGANTAYMDIELVGECFGVLSSFGQFIMHVN
ncbi:uncharacterized protein A4U43_C10F15350 [Asparagus officinalis]|uniref:Protein phosphatase methylesterase-1 n=1 Tax=Asparagus officinalis TaxID=4686 RepID=A0A5P1E2Z5_ASPOF|nr:uncharacterized protein A4U43_C10F15350 [Asparagus officinalis]